MVDTILRHLVGLVMESKAVPDSFVYTVAEEAVLFYADNGLISYTNPVWFQWVLGVLIILFERVRLRTNIAKTVAMVCQPGPIAGQHSAATYERRMTGGGDPHHMRQRHRVVCGYCSTDLATTYMYAHLHMQHSRSVQSRPLFQPPPLLSKR